MSPTCLHKLNYHYLHHSLHIVKVSTQRADIAFIIGVSTVATSFELVSTFEHTRLVRVWVFFFLFSFFFSYLAATGVGCFLRTFITVWVQGWLLAGIWQILAWYWYWYKGGIHLVLPHVPYQTGPSISLISLRLYPTSMFFSTSIHSSSIYSNNSLEVNSNLHCILYPQVLL
jgi:hypothetical protein